MRPLSFISLPVLFSYALSAFCLHSLALANQDLCRHLKFTTPVDGYALHGHVIKNITFNSGMRGSCKGRCTIDSNCVSINIGPTINDKVLCQLSNSDHIQHPDDVKPRDGFMYRGTENPCSSSPCTHNATCLNGFTDKKYLCVCQTGFTGKQCEKDINECNNGKSGCHVNANCTNTFGSYYCACKPGYTGDGHKCSGNKAYPLKLNSSLELDVYCHMTNDLGTCEGGGWTLVMKIDGDKMTFHYVSCLWSNMETFNPKGGETGFDLQETKIPTYWNSSFSKICLGMKAGEEMNFFVINKNANSLYSLIADGQYRATSLGRGTWKTLIGPEASLQSNCNREGFNSVADIGLNSKARIGLISNNENDCSTCDSRIGFGTGGFPVDTITCGNVARGVTDNGNKDIKAIGYILIQ